MSLSLKNLRDDVLATVAIIASEATASESDVVDRLMEQGYDRLRAEILIAFVPLGFGRTVIARMQTHPPISLSSTALIRFPGENRSVSVILSEIPEFEAARQLAKECFKENIISQLAFTSTCSISVELKLISDALTAGEEISGAKLTPPILLRLADAPGFDRWHKGLQTNSQTDQR